MATSCGAADLANQLLPSLIDGKDFSIPDVDLGSDDFKFPKPDPNDPIFGELKSLTNEDLTEKDRDNGKGTFDVVLSAVSKALKIEYDSGRITGNQYTQVYMESISVALGNSIQYLLSKDQSFWQSALIQQQAQAAQIAVIKAKLEAIALRYGIAESYYRMRNTEAEYALLKMKVATEDATYCATVAQKDQVDYTTKNILPAQKALTQEQVETARAQTMDTRSDGSTPVRGSVGKQKDLYTQQITSYQRDSEVKAAKLFTDAWITQKTIDEGLLAPNGFTNNSLDQVLVVLKRNNGFS